MKRLEGITVCHNCKEVFNGLPNNELICPECKSVRLTLVSNSGVYDSIRATGPGKNYNYRCPNLIDGICELTGEDVFADE